MFRDIMPMLGQFINQDGSGQVRPAGSPGDDPGQPGETVSRERIGILREELEEMAEEREVA